MGVIDGIFNFCSLCLTGKTLEEHEYISEEKDYSITDEELLTYSLLTGNKEMENAMLWKIWSNK